jgi:Na+/H+ antiporter NhaD/arsenite permease-like protein
MFILMIILFVVGYILIALEHPLKVNKSATALLLGVLLWVCIMIAGEGILTNPADLREFMMNNPGSGFKEWIMNFKIVEILGEISEILFFLLGAMTIVEIVDTQGGFKIITDRIHATNKVKLLWIVSILTFFLSAVLDNLTTAIVMVALLRKLIAEKKDRWFFASMVILAANSGGAFSPIGDVTTIMLWIGGKVSSLNIIEMTFFASLMSIVVPLIILSFTLKGEITRPQLTRNDLDEDTGNNWQSTLFLIVGVGALLFTPIFKTLTHLPPFMGILGGLGILWILSEIVHRKDSKEVRSQYSISNVLKRVDISTILFFLGILTAVNALGTAGHLELLANSLDKIPVGEPGKYYIINMIIGIASSVVDNVPLVAAGMGMYHFPMDHYFWEFLAYCAGTGGSILIIGSAAGVAVMGMEKIDFIWYLKHISWIALVGYFAGCGTFMLEKEIRSSLGDDQTVVKTKEIVFTNEGVKDFMNSNTFYLVQDSQEIKDFPTEKIISL